MAKSDTDQFLDHNKLCAKGEAVHRPDHPGEQPIQPSRRVAVVGCMDARLDIRPARRTSFATQVVWSRKTPSGRW
jgi:carbonic anhydrase